MLVLVKLQYVRASVPDIVALGLVVPGNPNFEAVQQRIGITAPDIKYLDVYRTDIAFRPIDEVSGSSRPRQNWQDYYD